VEVGRRDKTAVCDSLLTVALAINLTNIHGPVLYLDSRVFQKFCRAVGPDDGFSHALDPVLCQSLISQVYLDIWVQDKIQTCYCSLTSLTYRYNHVMYAYAPCSVEAACSQPSNSHSSTVRLSRCTRSEIASIAGSIFCHSPN